MLNFHNKYSYKIEEAVTFIKKRCVLFVPVSNIIRHVNSLQFINFFNIIFINIIKTAILTHYEFLPPSSGHTE